MAPSVRVVHLVTETQNWALTELGSTKRIQTWSVGIFFQALENGMVYFPIAPSARVFHLVNKMQKWALTELGYQESSNLVCRHIFQARKNGIVYFLIAPSARVVNLVTETQKSGTAGRITPRSTISIFTRRASIL